MGTGPALFTIAFGAGRDNQIRAWDSDTGKQLWSPRLGGNSAGNFHPDKSSTGASTRRQQRWPVGRQLMIRGDEHDTGHHIVPHGNA
jgi:hypothetical protein